MLSKQHFEIFAIMPENSPGSLFSIFLTVESLRWILSFNIDIFWRLIVSCSTPDDFSACAEAGDGRAGLSGPLFQALTAVRRPRPSVTRWISTHFSPVKLAPAAGDPAFSDAVVGPQAGRDFHYSVTRSAGHIDVAACG